MFNIIIPGFAHFPASFIFNYDKIKSYCILRITVTLSIHLLRDTSSIPFSWWYPNVGINRNVLAPLWKNTEKDGNSYRGGLAAPETLECSDRTGLEELKSLP